MNLLVIVFSLSLIILKSAKSAEVNETEPDIEYLPPLLTKAEESAQLIADGYQEYLPPLGKSIEENLSPVEEEDSDTVIADDGYRYKTVRKLKFRARQRRDVSEVKKPSNDYLPPVNDKVEPEIKTVLADDGYHYQIVKRLKYRRDRRDTKNAVDVVPDPKYLPPVTETDASSPNDTVEVKSADLTDDGYHYKTLRKVIYRARQ